MLYDFELSSSFNSWYNNELAVWADKLERFSKWYIVGPVRMWPQRLEMAVRDYSSETHNHKYGPNLESTATPPLVFTLTTGSW